MRKHETTLMCLIWNKVLESFATTNNYKVIGNSFRTHFAMIETEVYQYEEDENFCY